MGFINSAEQIFADVFNAQHLFAVSFAIAAGFMAIAALINSRIVEELGTRRVSHGALLGFILACLIRLAIVLSGHETLVTFVAMQAMTMFFFGLTASNFGSMAMEEMGSMAGTASSVQGFCSTLIGVFVGLVISQSFVDDSFPLTLGFAISGLISLALVLLVERGRLFRPHHRQPAVPPVDPAAHG